MKKIIYTLILSLVVVGGLVFANREIKKEPSKKATSKSPTAVEMKAARKQWEASPEVSCTKNGKRMLRVKKCMPVKLK